MRDERQMNLFDARAARDEGIGRVTNNNKAWMTQALGLIEANDFGEAIAEEIRLRLRDLGLPPPLHHNAWGGLINAAIRRRLLSKTGRWGQMRTKRSHARATPLLRKCNG